MQSNPTLTPYIPFSKRIAIFLFSLINFYAGFAQYGMPDNTFGTGGKITGGFTGYENRPYSIIQQSDGKILVGGEISYNQGSTYTREILVSRFNTDGTTDLTFGNGGADTTDFPNAWNGGCSLSLQTDGKIIAAGYAQGNLVLIRYLTNGQLDNVFGTNGIALFSIPVETAYSPVQVKAMPDGSIIASGTAYSGMGSGYSFMAMRCDSFGIPDTAFGTNGVIFRNNNVQNWYCYSMVIQCDGKILLAGCSTNSASSPFAFTILRFNANGRVDNTFGNNGMVVTIFPGSVESSCTAIGVNADGKIVVTGWVEMNQEFLCGFAQYLSDGSVDNTFGNNGIVTLNNIGVPHAMVIQPDQKVLVGGELDGGGIDEEDGGGMARLNVNGSLDNTFGQGGIVGNFSGTGTSIDMQSDGKILLTGYTWWPFNILVGRFTSGLNSGPIDTCHYPPFSDIDTFSAAIAIPDAFTPNDDHVNDTFLIPHSGTMYSFSIHIYDRFGQLVFSTSDINSGWDGKYAGKAQPEGIFLFTICTQEYESSSTVCQEGKLTLLR